MRRRLVVTLGAGAMLGLWLMSAANPGRFDSNGRADRRLAALAAAAGTSHSVAGRLTGGFLRGAPRRVDRSGSPGSNARLLAAAAAIQLDVENDRSPEHLAAWGVAQLLLGKVPDAIRSLEMAVALDDSSGAAWSNLAAAYIGRAAADGDSDDWPMALEAAERALKTRPELIEARYNRALVLDHLALRTSALEAWQAYLSLDASSDWAAEADRHRQSLKAAAAAPSLLVFPDARAPAAVLAGLADTQPQLGREFADLVLWPAWALALQAGDAGAERLHASQLSAVSSTLSQHGYRALPEHLRLSARLAPPATGLAAAHVAFARGLRQFESDQIAESAIAFEEARRLFTPLGTPYLLWCDIQLMMVDYIRGDGAGAQRRAGLLRANPALATYPEIDARLHWLEGLFAGARSDLQAGFTSYEQAAVMFSKLGERENATFLNTLTGEALDVLGDRRQAWRHRVAAIRERGHARNLRRPHTTLLSAAVSALQHGWREVAQHLADEDVNLTDAAGQALVRVEAHLARARVSASRGDEATATGSIATAHSLLSGLSPALQQRYAGDVLAMRGRLDVPDADELSLQAAALLEQQGGALRVPELLHRAATVRLARGDKSGAAAVLAGAIDRLAAQVPASIESMRWSYADSVWPVFRQAALLELEHGEIEQAVEMAERGRFGPARDPRGAVARVQALLDSRTSVVRFIVGATVHAVVIRATTINHIAISMTSGRLDHLMRSYLVEAVGDAAPSAQVLSVLGQELVQPLLPWVPEGDTVAILPDGPLHHVALAGIRLPDGRFLIERNAIEIWAQLEPRPVPEALPRPGGLVAIGVGAFQSQLPALLNAEAEAGTVAAIHSGRAIHGPAATPQALRAAATTATMLHFSTHALANPDFPNLSWIALAPDPAHPNGLLFAHEIRRLDLRGVTLVFLSTCDGARGQLSRSEGAASLARAFLDAGATAVIASGWRIDDALAHSLSAAFHRDFAAGASASEALREAQLTVIKSNARGLVSPFSWSSFQLYRRRGSHDRVPVTVS